MWIWYSVKNESVVIHRLFGDQPEVAVPGEIDGKRVTGVGGYAFSEKEVPLDGCHPIYVDENQTGSEETRDVGMQDEQKLTERKRFDRELADGLICELAGDFVIRVELPDGLKSIGELCFYQCRNLSEISFGGGLTEIGSDAFMNCRSLCTIRIRAGVDQPTTLRSILNQRTQETDVLFDDAAVHFPEYQEKYDLIGPAHIFELNIEGEGFRARKCFDGDRFDLTMYDEVFRRAIDTEEERTLCRMAALRLRGGTGGVVHGEASGRAVMPETAVREMYQTYLLDHMEVFCDDVIKRRDLNVLAELDAQGLLKKEHREVCLKKMAEARWIEGTRALLANGGGR